MDHQPSVARQNSEPMAPVAKNADNNAQCALETPRVADSEVPQDFYLGDLFRQLGDVCGCKPTEKTLIREGMFS